MSNFQRDGAVSNSHVGRAFEKRVQKILAKSSLQLDIGHKIPCGLGTVTKGHAFDLGAESPKIIVECKSHTWTATGRVPSAKLKDWAVAMYYSQMAPKDYRKIFVVERSLRHGRGESLLNYFLRTHTHMLPHDVEFWELDGDELTVRKALSGKSLGIQPQTCR